MSAFIDRSLESLDFLSDDFRSAIRRRIGELIGFAMVGVALAMTLALATWSVQDPSLSHATDRPVRNMLGHGGAIFADLSVQLFGLASIMLVLPIAIWGWRMMTHRVVNRFGLRAIFWVGGLLLATAFASCLPRSGGWPLPAGFGGVVGDAMLKLPMFILGDPLPGMSRLLLGAITGAGALALLVIASGIVLRQPADLAEEIHREAEEFEEEDERTSISIGWIVHTLLSAKARVMLFVRKKLASDDELDDLPAPAAKSRVRAEPRMRRPELEPEQDYEEEAED